jgi:excisionase family DNA binding protein
MNELILVDINELSRRIGIPKGTLYQWVYLRRIPFIKAGRSLRFGGKVKGPPPRLWCGLAGACLCARKRFRDGCCFWSVRN